MQVDPGLGATDTSKSIDESQSQIDPSLADWFQVDEKDAGPSKALPEDDSETEPESDNMDVQDLDADVEDGDDDDWYNFQTAEVSLK